MRSDLFRTPLLAFTIRFCCAAAALAAVGGAAAGQTGTFPAGGVNLGSVAVNTGTPAQATLTFTFTAGGTIAAPAVLTQGAKDLDFTDAGTGTCTTNGASHSYKANDTCTVVVKFAPKFPGIRYGAVVLSNSSNAPIATGYIYGTGTGPELAFSGSAPIALEGEAFRDPWGIAVDAAGNVYFTRYGVSEIPRGCASSDCVIALGGVGGEPNSVAVDGAGNVYFTDANSDKVAEIPVGCLSSTCVTALGGGFASPNGIAVDGSGNVYVASPVIVEMPPGCTSADCVTTLGGGGFLAAWGLAVDGSGNVYFSGSAVFEMSAGCASSGCVKTLGGGFSRPQGVAVDASGTVYVADYDAGVVKAIPAGCAASNCVITLISDVAPASVAVDGEGNVYIANDFSDLAVVEQQRTNAPSLTFATTGVGQTSTDSPQTVTVQNVGTDSVEFSEVSYPTDFPETGNAANDCTASKDLAAGAFCSLSINFTPLPSSVTGGSAALSESVDLTDNTLNESGAAQSVAVSGTAVGPELVFATPPVATILVGNNAGSAITVDEEFADTAVLMSTTSITLTVTYPDTTTQTYIQTPVNGAATFDLSGVSLTEPGTYTYTATAVELTSATAIGVVNIPPFTAPTTTVGSASAAQAVTLTMGSNFTLGSIAVVTQGAPNLDFQVAAGGSCTVGVSYVGGQACTVDYTFSPKFAGTRYGAVVLYDHAVPAHVVATAYLQGTGTGPQVVFSPATVTVPGGTANYNAVAADASGNIYVAGSAGVQRIPPGCASSACMTTLGGGFNSPEGLAVDGSGNVYVADTENSAVKEIPLGCASSSCVISLGGTFTAGPYTKPAGVAVDGGGNVYVTVDGEAKEIPLDCYFQSCVTTLPGNLPNPTGVAVDGSGNVYVAYASSPHVGVYEIPAGCASSACITNVGGGYSLPVGIAIDGLGQVFVADWGDNKLDEVPVTCRSSSCVKTLFGWSLSLRPEAVAVNGSDNVYAIIAPSNLVRAGALTELDRADGSSLTFSPTASGKTSSDSPQTVTVENIGNQPLHFPVLTSGNNPSLSSSNFILDSSAANACAVIGSAAESGGLLAAGAVCDLAISFSPGIETAATDSGTLTLTDDSLNAAPPGYATQSVALSGSALLPFGALAQPIDATTRATSVAQNDDVLVAGWAADPQLGAPVSQVAILIDGNAAGNATLGLPRPDIAASYNNLAYYKSGWTFSLPASGLSVGSHTASAVAYDSQGAQAELFQTRTFAVTAAAVAGPPFGAIAQPIDATTRATTVAQSDNVLIEGWAADAHDGAPVKQVEVLVDNQNAGNATLGIARPDIATAYGSTYRNSGWTFSYSAAGLAIGTHIVSAIASDSIGNSTQFATKTITVSATQVAGPPFGALGKAVDATTGTTTVSQSDNLFVRGWAADFHDGAPVATVSILIDGTAVGNATLGFARLDVVAATGNSAYLNSGWTFTYAADSLSAGSHTVTAVATDSLGMSTQLEIRSITVTAGGSD